eukprot:TRINITY_DN2496_c0_g1_i1.p1 TRINITY_DN2496_c0_g1~~TRINITY_DN2496_c0_g1_i1.p1  ORF type:complete len:416 (+),score=91.38 TRINITY_DN2496_c0_g1_i1:92-1339(+)
MGDCEGEDAGRGEVFGLINGDLLGVLYNVGVLRKWTDDDLATVVRKLVKVRLVTVSDLLRVIQCKVLNPRLKAAGEKAFSKETLRQIVSLAGLAQAGGVSLIEVDRAALDAFASNRSRAQQPTDGLVAAHPVVGPEALAWVNAEATNEPPIPVEEQSEAYPDQVPQEECAEPAPAAGAVPEEREPAEASPPATPKRPAATFSNNPLAAFALHSVPTLSYTTWSHLQSGAADDDDAESLDEYVQHARIQGYERYDAVTDVPEWRVVYVPLEWIYYYQTTVAGVFSDGRPLQKTVDDLRSGRLSPSTLPLINLLVVDGMLFGMGTRRLVCYQHLWGLTYPEVRIPALYCHKTCTGKTTHSLKGLEMKVIGMLFLDNIMHASVQRERRKGPAPSFGYLEAEFNEGRKPVYREGEPYLE